MALLYGYLFPLIFLLSFWALYRNDSVPLALHMGELLTITILGGACFGLPTALVSERERGVWRRYRVTPVPTWVLIGSTLAARFGLLITAGVMQIVGAMALGMPMPLHPLGLLLAFTAVSIALLGVGMLIAMLANSVPAVQALGQCIFLPMLIIGGVAVRLESLPGWALQASAFLPGRYAVSALQESTTGQGLGQVLFECAALLVMGIAAGIAATRLYRWDTVPRRISPTSGVWIGAALVTWLSVGLFAGLQDRVDATAESDSATPLLEQLIKRAPPVPAEVQPQRAEVIKGVPDTQPAARSPTEPTPAPQPDWRSITVKNFDEIAYERLPADDGIVAPIARPGEVPDPIVVTQLDTIRSRLADWAPAEEADPVQRVRNLLFVAAVPDILQMAQLERQVPVIVEEELRRRVPPADLPKLLYWVAMHPDQGSDEAIGSLEALGLPAASGPTKSVRGRVMVYAMKLLGRQTGAIKP
jgi:ABC-2 type transport system permease protein